MKVLSVALFALMLIPAGWSLLHLVLLVRNFRAPAESRTHAAAVLCGCFLTQALWHGGNRRYAAMILPGLLGAGCGLVWFYLIYRQSLHNTTM